MSEARQKFEAKLQALYAGKPNNTYMINKYEYEHKIRRLMEIRAGEMKTNHDQRLLKHYCLVEDNSSGMPVAKLCKVGTSLTYVTSEDLYDVLEG